MEKMSGTRCCCQERRGKNVIQGGDERGRRNIGQEYMPDGKGEMMSEKR